MISTLFGVKTASTHAIDFEKIVGRHQFSFEHSDRQLSIEVATSNF